MRESPRRYRSDPVPEEPGWRRFQPTWPAVLLYSFGFAGVVGLGLYLKTGSFAGMQLAAVGGCCCAPTSAGSGQCISTSGGATTDACHPRSVSRAINSVNAGHVAVNSPRGPVA